MLVLSRQRDESIMIGDNIVVTIVDIRGDKVRLGINAPTEIPVHRQEVYEAIQRENVRASRLEPKDTRSLGKPGRARSPCQRGLGLFERQYRRQPGHRLDGPLAVWRFAAVATQPGDRSPVRQRLARPKINFQDGSSTNVDFNQLPTPGTLARGTTQAANGVNAGVTLDGRHGRFRLCRRVGRLSERQLGDRRQ